MPDLPTRVDLFNVGRDDILTRAEARPEGRRITPEAVDTPGTDINLLMSAASAMGGEIVSQLARCLSDLTLDGASGEALDRWVADRYSPEVARKGAAAALATVSFSRPTNAFGAFTYPAGARVATEGGIQFELTTSASFPAASVGPITASARAVNAGVSGNVDAGRITRFITQPDDTTLTVTNPETAAGGADTETDASLRERARQFFTAARRGTAAAIEFGARTVAGVVQATAVEEVDSSGVLTGRVDLFIADAQGQGNALLVSQVSQAITEFRCAGISVDVIGATPVFTPITLNLRFETTVDTTVAFEQVRTVVVGRVNQLAPGAILERSLIFEACRSVPGVIVLDDAVVAPAGDVVPGTGEILRTRTDLVTQS